MEAITRGFEKEVSTDLILKIANTEEEGQRLAEFNELIHGEGVGDYVMRLFSTHPDKDDILWFYIENAETKEILSSLALLPFEWQIRGYKFPVAEMGFVGTREEFRGEGYFAVLNEFYELAVKEKEYILSALVGIPHFYKKYGYEFAISRYTGYNMPTANIPSEEIDHVKIRKAHEDDLDAIHKLYDEKNRRFVVSTVFDKKKINWRYMNTTCDTFNSMTYIIEEDRKTKAFFTIGSLNNPDQADIILMSYLTHDQMVKVLQFVKTYNIGSVTSFQILTEKKSMFGQYLESKGADELSEWPWQIQIPDLLNFFRTMKPVLEERIENSIFQRITKDIKISDYTKTITIHIKEGKIEGFDSIKQFPSRDVDLRVPYPYYIRLFLSNRSFEEIAHIISDTIMKKESKLLLKVLFPRITSLPISYYQ